MIYLHVACKLQKSSRIFKFDSAEVCLHGINQWYTKLPWWGLGKLTWVLKAAKLHSHGIFTWFYVHCSCGFPTGWCGPALEKYAHWSNHSRLIWTSVSYMCVLFSNNNIYIWVWPCPLTCIWYVVYSLSGWCLAHALVIMCIIDKDALHHCFSRLVSVWPVAHDLFESGT